MTAKQPPSSSHERRNYYRILNVQPDAPVEIIKNNYRTLMQKLKLHPDLGGNVQEAAFINEAYQVLSDAKQRAKYDDELLAEYGIESLSQGNLHQPDFANNASLSNDSDGHGNQRNYYRLLNVQTDAPEQIIRSSYLAIKKNANDKLTRLLNEAYSVISNNEKRKLYDQLLAKYDHVKAVELLFKSTRVNLTTINKVYSDRNKAYNASSLNTVYGHATNAPYRPVITQYCQFCKTPHDQSPCEDTAPLCNECNSPLFPPSNAFMEQSRRDIVRLVQRNSECNAYLSWPGNGMRAKVSDLSPLGMQIQTSIRLDEDQIIKLDGHDFKAVGKVTHSRNEFEGEDFSKHVCGVKFLTVNFNKLKGQFFSANA